MQKRIHVVVFDGYADWEPALALAEARRSGGYHVVTVGYSLAPVLSMGGLRVLPDMSLGDVDPAAVRMLLLPGGEAWERGEYRRRDLEELVRDILSAGGSVAAICAATVALARAGVLDTRAHTSNFAGYLAELAIEYRGRSNYRDDLAVRDQRVITAPGTAPAEFAREVLAELGVFSDGVRQAWFETMKTGRWVMPVAS